MITTRDHYLLHSRWWSVAALLHYAVWQVQGGQLEMFDTLLDAARVSRSLGYMWYCDTEFSSMLLSRGSPHTIALAAPYIYWLPFIRRGGGLVQLWVAAVSAVPYTEEAAQGVVETLFDVASYDTLLPLIPVDVWDIETLKSYFLIVWSEWVRPSRSIPEIMSSAGLRCSPDHLSSHDPPDEGGALVPEAMDMPGISLHYPPDDLLNHDLADIPGVICYTPNRTSSPRIPDSTSSRYPPNVVDRMPDDSFAGGFREMQIAIQEDFDGIGMGHHRVDLIERLAYVIEQLDRGLEHIHRHNPCIDERDLQSIKRRYRKLQKILLEMERRTSSSTIILFAY